MKCFKIVSIIFLVISVLVSVDLGVNLIASSKMQDGIGYQSILQSSFGILEELEINTLQEFFNVFVVSIGITFIFFIENIVLSINKKTGF